MNPGVVWKMRGANIPHDEPNAEKNYADLLKKVPWAKRVHGVKGSDAAHKAAAPTIIPRIIRCSPQLHDCASMHMAR